MQLVTQLFPSLSNCYLRWYLPEHYARQHRLEEVRFALKHGRQPNTFDAEVELNVEVHARN